MQLLSRSALASNAMRKKPKHVIFIAFPYVCAILASITLPYMVNFQDRCAANTIPLLTQVAAFTATRAQMELQLSSRELKKLLSKSLFLIGMGTCDLFRASLLQALGISTKFDPSADVQYVASSLAAAIRALHDAGARKFAVINAPPIGCAPGGRMPWLVRGRRVHVPNGRCDETKNKLVVEFNDGIRHLMANLSSELDGLRYSIADFYGFANATFVNPSAAGIYGNPKSFRCKQNMVAMA